MHRDPPQVVGQVVEVAGARRDHQEHGDEPENDPRSPVPPARGGGMACSPLAGAVDLDAECFETPERVVRRRWWGVPAATDHRDVPAPTRRYRTRSGVRSSADGTASTL